MGLDIEPEASFYEQIMEHPWGLVTLLLRRLRDTERPRRAQAAYDALIDQRHGDGYSEGTPPDQARYSSGRRVGGRHAFACPQAAQRRSP